MLKFEFDGSDLRVIAGLDVTREKLLVALTERMTKLMTRLQEKVRTEKLSGEVLNRVTGKLQDSVRDPGAHQEGNDVVGTLKYGGGEAWYAQMFENGWPGDGVYAINPIGTKGTRQHIKGAKRRFGKDVLRFWINGQKIFAAQVFHPAQKKLPFMAPALQEMRKEIADGLRDTIIANMPKKPGIYRK